MAERQKVSRKKDSNPRMSLGFLGEQVTKKHLISKGLDFVASNYRRKCGEIDLIMRTSRTILFFEVKTVSRERFCRPRALDEYRPEDNVHHNKLKKIAKTANLWLEEQNFDCSTDWSINIASVYFSVSEKKFYINILWGI